MRRPLLDGVGFNILSVGDNCYLCARVETKKIRETVWYCESNKSPGPDDFNFKFIKAFWEILKVYIQRAVEDFWANGVWSRGSNASFIILIPKVSSPRVLTTSVLSHLLVVSTRLSQKSWQAV